MSRRADGEYGKAYYKKEKQRILRDKIEELPENYRGVVKGYYLQDKTFKELAEEENVLPKSIEVKLYRARQWMKKHWKEDEFS
ncbi:sigma factor-like helix-turn-helix DNA-binding protein [Bacillus sp. N9]